VTFERTRDLERVRRAIANDARIWSASTDDTAPNSARWKPSRDERIWYVVAIEGCEAVATLTLVPENAVTYQVHMDRVFGARPARALREFFAWAFEHTPARRIGAAIPADNPIAIRAARRAGMTQYGINPASFLRGGKLQDQILFGVSKPCPAQ
jgi:hypothetical protein